MRAGGWISPNLLATIRIIQATEDEFAIIGTGEATDEGGVRSTYDGGVVSKRNEMATYASLRELLYAKLRPETAQVSHSESNETSAPPASTCSVYSIWKHSRHWKS